MADTLQKRLIKKVRASLKAKEISETEKTSLMELLNCYDFTDLNPQDIMMSAASSNIIEWSDITRFEDLLNKWIYEEKNNQLEPVYIK